MDKRVKESIAFLGKGLALSGPGREEGEIPKHEYDVVSDEVVEGVRTIKLKERDRTEILAKVRKLADTIAEKIGEGDSRAFKDLLFDAIKHYWDEEIEKMYKKVVEGIAPVKARRGCFEIIIGDGRRKNASFIRLLE